MENKLPEEIKKQIEAEAKKAAMIVEYCEYDAGPASSARMAQTSRIDPIQKEFYIKGATEWVQWKVKYDDLKAENIVLQQKKIQHELRLSVYEKEVEGYKNEQRQLKARCDKMDAALNKIIEMNRQHASDQYGDAEKAETWGCVMVAREAIAGKEVKLTPEQIADRKAAIEWYRNPEGEKEGEKRKCDCSVAFKAAHGKCYNCPLNNPH